MKRMVKRLERTFLLAESPPSHFPFVAEHHLPKVEFAEALQLEKYEGLLFSEIITGCNGEKKIVSFWNDAVSFNCQKDQYTTAIGDGKLLCTGFHLKLIVRAVPFFKRFTPLPLILSATTLLGAWGTFNSNYKEWF